MTWRYPIKIKKTYVLKNSWSNLISGNRSIDNGMRRTRIFDHEFYTTLKLLTLIKICIYCKILQVVVKYIREYLSFVLFDMEIVFDT